MGTIKTTNIEPIADNGTVTLGSSGDTFTVPSGVTVNMSNATQTGVGGVNTPAFFAYMSSDLNVSDNTKAKRRDSKNSRRDNKKRNNIVEEVDQHLVHMMLY